MKDNQAKYPQLRFKGFTDPWEERKLGEVAILSSSKRIHLSDYVTEGIPFYRGSEISTGGITGNQELFISQEKFDEIKEKYGVPSEGDILVTAVGTLGNLWKVDSRRFYYKDGNLIQISKMQVNSDYLLTYFTGGIGKKRLLDSAAGSNQKALTMVKMREITVDFPSEDEQKKIGAFFKSLDDTIALHQRKLVKLKKLKQGYLQKMFPKNGSKFPQLRFAGFADAWEQRKLREFTSYESSSYSSSQFNYTDLKGDFPVFDANKEIARISEYAQKSKYISIIKDGAGIGRTELRPAKSSIIGTMGYILPKASDVNFVYSLMQNINWGKFQNGSTIPHVYYKDYGEEKFYVPKLKEQKEIGKLFYDLDKLITLHQRKLALLKDKKKAYLQKMFI